MLALFSTTLMGAGLSLGGCDHALFAQDDREVDNRLSYFPDATSARQERETRRENSNLGFGYPTGPGSQ